MCQKTSQTKVTFDGIHNHPPYVIFHHEKYLVALNWVYKMDHDCLINLQKHDDYDMEGQGVLNALTQYVNTDDRLKADNLIDIYQTGMMDEQQVSFEDEADQLKHLFPHII